MVPERVLHVPRPTPILSDAALEASGQVFKIEVEQNRSNLDVYISEDTLKQLQKLLQGLNNTILSHPDIELIKSKSNIIQVQNTKLNSDENKLVSLSNDTSSYLPSIRTLECLLQLRDAILGHATLRKHFVVNFQLVQLLSSHFQSYRNCICGVSNDCLGTFLTRETISVIGSIANGSPAEIDILVQFEIPQALLDILISTSNLIFDNQKISQCKISSIKDMQSPYNEILTYGLEAICEGAARALRTLYRNPKTPRDLPFSEKNFPSILRLLSLANPIANNQNSKSNHRMDIGNTSEFNPAISSLYSTCVSEYCAVMLANCCDSLEKQVTLIANFGVEIAIGMASARDAPHGQIEGSLDLLAALTRDNEEACKLAIDLKAVDMLISLARISSVINNPRSEIPILASVCIANISRCVNSPCSSSQISNVILPTLSHLLTQPRPIHIRSAQVISLLVAQSETLQMATIATDLLIVPRLAKMLDEDILITCNVESSLTRQIVHPQVYTACEAALLALAAISTYREECRRAVIEAGVLSNVVRAMNVNATDGRVRSAACQLARSLSRSVKSLRTTLVDAGIAAPLLKLLSDPIVNVQSAAAAALCNLVLDFSPMKTTVLEAGGASRLIELVFCNSFDENFVGSIKNDDKDQSVAIEIDLECTNHDANKVLKSSVDIDVGKNLANDEMKSSNIDSRSEIKGTNAELRFNALWALKNLLYLADTSIKLAVLDQITCPRLETLARDKEPLIQEQAVNLLRNLVCEREQDIAAVLDRFGISRLISLVEDCLDASSPEVVVHACYVIANACTASNSSPKSAVMSSQKIISRLHALLDVRQPPQIQLGALWCVINLSWNEDPTSAQRIGVLRAAGIETQLRNLIRSRNIDGDIRDRVQTALENFLVTENESRRGSRSSVQDMQINSPESHGHVI